MTTTLSQWEAGPFNAGVNISQLPSEINDNEAVVIQDMFLDKPGQIYARGPVVNVVQSTPTINGTTASKGLFATTAPDGVQHLAAITQQTSANNLRFHVLADDGGSVQFTQTLDSIWPTTSDTLVDAKPALDGGVWVGCQELNATPSQRGRQVLFHWKGATKASYRTGTITSTLGSTAVTGVGTAWLTGACPGMFLVDTAERLLVGVVKTVNSDTSITLERPAIWSLGSTYALLPIRAFGLEINKGRVKTVGPTPGPASTTVIGSGTKFLSQNVVGYKLFRARDNTFVGTIASVSGDEGMTLNAGALVTMDNEPFVIRLPAHTDTYEQFVLPPSSGTAGVYPGILNATYAQLQWFARLDGGASTVGAGDLHSRVWFSDYRNMESLDMQTQDGDFIQIPSTVGQNLPIRGIAPASNALLVFKENETFAIMGDEPDNFDPVKIWDDGCLSPASIVTYKGTVIWAGRNGIYLYDGKTVSNIVSRSLGTNSWQSFVAAFDPRVHRITAAYYRDHYFLTVNSTGNDPATGSPPIMYTTVKNATVSQKLPPLTFAIFIPTLALSFVSHLNIKGWAVLNQQTFYFITSPYFPTGGYVCNFATLFSDVNTVATQDYPDTTTGGSPDPYFESKRYSMGDPLRKKMFKQVMATWMSHQNNVLVEICPGLNQSNTSNTFTLLTGNLPLGAINIAQTLRVKFLKRDRFLAVKFYQDTTTKFGDLQLRRFALGYKWMKVGRT